MKRPSLRGLLGKAGRVIEKRAPTAAALWRSVRDPAVADALRRGRLRIVASELTMSVGRTARLAEVGVRCVPELVLIDGVSLDGERVHVVISVERAIFAPRGGKELVLELDPPELDRVPWARQAAAGLAVAIATRLGIAGDVRGDAVEAAITREGAGLLRIDLRALGRAGRSIGDVLPVHAVEVVEGAIELALPLPPPFVR